ncbi:MAG: hypothetical protein O9330_18510 [Beijerinckiaceae bacterium]|jgi:hypothetical protein|nr:hypothetical protein [Beijerinckiaceae bacterium]
MSKTYSGKSIELFQGRTVVFDANVWIFINGYCNPNKAKTDAYSEIYKKLIERNIEVGVTDQVIYEILNRIIKFEYELACQNDTSINGKFKSYRASKEFAPAMQGAVDTCYHIITDNMFYCIDHNKAAFLDIVDRSAKGLMDPNDISLYDYCKSKGYTLATDDGDFVNCDIDLITENNFMLNKRKSISEEGTTH